MPDYSTPAEFKPGCLPRRSRPGEVCPLFGERIDVIPEGDWPDLIEEIDLAPHVWQILDQDGVGSCATESTTQAVMATREFRGQERVLLNPWFMYHTTSGGRDGGSNIDDNLVFARDKGIVPESVWPRSKGWRAKPSAEAYDAALAYRIEEFYDISNVAEFGTALLLGFPVVFGYPGHSILGVSLKTVDIIKYANSWRPDWGDNGFGTCRFRDVVWGYGAWAVRTTTRSE